MQSTKIVTYKKKIKCRYPAVIQVDKITYNKIMSAGGLFIGYDFCYAFDAIEILRCFNCNGFPFSPRPSK
jgi:hypothetical protein